MHVVQRGNKSSFVSTPMRHFVGTIVRMHRGKDGDARQLCGPGITHLMPGRAKKVHI